VGLKLRRPAAAAGVMRRTHLLLMLTKCKWTLAAERIQAKNSSKQTYKKFFLFFLVTAATTQNRPQCMTKRKKQNKHIMLTVKQRKQKKMQRTYTK